MTRLDCYASLEHYWHHLEPIWAALPPEARGRLLAPAASKPWGERIPARWPRDSVVLVASYADALKARPRPVILLEHGAGQTYPGDVASRGHASYPGGSELDSVVLFLCPSERVAAAWQDSYPTTRVAVVGCPRLDRWHRDIGPKTFSGNVTPVVAVTFHWDCELVPETRTAFPHFSDALADLNQEPGFRVLGHGHPRIWGVLERRWRELGAAHTPDLARVFDLADVLVADNTSAMWEFASLGRPIVVLDSPRYRRDVDHGLRFWTHADAGVRIQDPALLVEAVRLALADPSSVAERRRRAVAEVYAATDGLAAQRAATAILELLEAPMPNPFAPTRTRRVREVRSVVDELSDRLRALGAKESDLAEFREAWVETMNEAGDERTELEARTRELLRSSDDTLRRMIAAASGDDPDELFEEPIEQDPTAVAIGVSPEPAAPPAETPEPSGDEFDITWTVPQLIEWAGEDPERRTAILEAEEGVARLEGREPRRTLVAALGGNGSA